ncbi:MAG: FIST C-terminal domain-containing protein [Treponema sp.]|nr:FIST C-terminal domain-containing protein [Treponema sp.]
MLNIKVGSSQLQDAFEAGKAAAGAMAGAKFAFVYSSVNYDQAALVKGVKAAVPGIAVAGNTSFTGVVTQEGFVGGDHFVGIMSMDGDVTAGVAGSAKGDCAETVGKSVAEAAMKNAGKTCPPDFFYMVASPGEEESYLKGITQVIGRVPFFGGSAADGDISGKWKLFADEMVTGDGVAVAFFYTGGKFANKYTGAYGESKKSGVITKVNGKRCLMEIDGIPAIKKYAEWSGKDVEKLKGGNLLVETICNPLGVKDRLGDLIAIRHPMFGNDDLSMNIGSDLSENTAVIYMEGSVDKLIKSNSETLQALQEKLPNAKGYYLVHCGGRRAGIGDRMEEAVAEIKKAAGNVPFLCQFTFGEYGFEKDGNNTCGGLMLSFTAFGD